MYCKYCMYCMYYVLHKLYVPVCTLQDPAKCIKIRFHSSFLPGIHTFKGYGFYTKPRKKLCRKLTMIWNVITYI